MKIRVLRQSFAVVALAGLTAACATGGNNVNVPPNAGVYKIGNPYQIGDTWYYPHEQPDYDETGIASWYGPTFYGHRTANGEVFDAEALSAAHRTLPMPVNVRVTNLENGKSLVVRVNDRGPYAKGRIIDLSERAAKLLGYYGAGTARVRVTYVARADLNGRPISDTPPEIANAVPAAPAGQVAQKTLAGLPGIAMAAPVEATDLPPLPAPLMAAPPTPSGQVVQVPVPPVTHLYVQVGAFSSYDNALRLKARLGGDLQISSIQHGGQTFYRVRTAPLGSTADADAALARLSGLGSNDAHIVVDQ